MLFHIILVLEKLIFLKECAILVNNSMFNDYPNLIDFNEMREMLELLAKFQYILTNYNANEIYEMENQTLNNLYEDIESLKQIKNVAATVQV